MAKFSPNIDMALSLGDFSNFYKYFSLALDNPKPIDGISVDLYELDKRWATDRFKKDSTFIKIMRSHGSKKFMDSTQIKKELAMKQAKTIKNEVHKPKEGKKVKSKSKTNDLKPISTPDKNLSDPSIFLKKNGGAPSG